MKTRGAHGVTSEVDREVANVALGRAIASVPEATVMGAYNSVSAIADPGAPAIPKV